MFHYLIYTSKAVGEWPESKLHLLLKSAQEKNEEMGITGMLVFLNQRFLQFIEGEKAKIDMLYSLISQDNRHERVVQLLEGRSKNRLFEGWSMGFKRINDADVFQMTGFRELESFFDQKPINDQSHPALIFLKIFYEKNYRDLQYVLS